MKGRRLLKLLAEPNPWFAIACSLHPRPSLCMAPAEQQARLQTFTAVADATAEARLSASQVVLGAQSLLANGGIMAPGGAGLVALAAQRHAVPFVVLVGLYKLSPLFPHDPALTFNEFRVRPADLSLKKLAVSRPRSYQKHWSRMTQAHWLTGSLVCLSSVQRPACASRL